MIFNYLKRKRDKNNRERIETLRLTKEEYKALQGIEAIAPLLIFMGIIFMMTKPEMSIKQLYRRAKLVLFASSFVFIVAIIVGEFTGLWGILPLGLFGGGLFYFRSIVRKAQRLEIIESAKQNMGIVRFWLVSREGCEGEGRIE